MNKIVKRKLICSIICLVLGAISIIFSKISSQTISEELSSYMWGFGCGILAVGLYVLIMSIRAIKNPQKAKQMANEYTDERIKSISNISQAITFKITVITEALMSMISMFLGKSDVAFVLGMVVCVELVVYVAVYFVVNKKH